MKSSPPCAAWIPAGGEVDANLLMTDTMEARNNLFTYHQSHKQATGIPTGGGT